MEECTALASWMTYKCALHDMKLGGGKGGISLNPRDHSEEELCELSRQYVDQFHPYIGAGKDVPAPDVGTGAALMDVMNLRMWEKTGSLAHFTGKSVGKGGSLGRTEATGLGVAYATELWCAANKRPMPEMTYVMQGFGNVGSYTAKFLSQQGMRLVCVTDHTGSVYDEQGIDVAALTEHVKAEGGVGGYGGGTKIPTEYSSVFAVPCDVMIPAALEMQITADNVDQVNASVVMEAANGPVSLEAEAALVARGVDVVPDIFANSGGVIVSNFEYERNQDFDVSRANGVLGNGPGYLWSGYESEKETVIHADMRYMMSQTFREIQRVLGVKREEGVDATYRDACYAIAIQNIERGLVE
jgi:glutamate dehydrogenase (NAD(P)+)